ncbi:MAG: hypothetical protein H7Y04_11380, partial [Verrucomicrobia bacterium]|nr:hypothetical protein [Cytophagales bacterium]
GTGVSYQWQHVKFVAQPLITIDRNDEINSPLSWFDDEGVLHLRIMA